MAEFVHILTPRWDSQHALGLIGPAATAHKGGIEWRDGRALMRLDTISQREQAAEMSRRIAAYTAHFDLVAEGEDLAEMTRRLDAARFIVTIRATPNFAAAAADSQSIAALAAEFDGTCITDTAVIDPFTGDAILQWGE